jgi:multiple sugar transport system permease protein
MAIGVPLAGSPRRRPTGADWMNRDRGAALAMLAPNFVMFSIFVGVPVLGGLALSFCSWGLVGWPHWAGLANYRQLFHDPIVPTALVNTLLFAAFGVVPTVAIGLLLAVFVNVRVRGIGALRTLYTMPAVISFVASAVLWQWIYHPSTGLLDYLLSFVGINGPSWLSNTTLALPALDMVGIWLALPVSMLLYLAALQRIPETTIEAATLDGAGAYRRLVHIIWPSVRPMTLLVAIVAFIGFTSGSFDLVNTMTQGGPVNATTTLIYYTYDVAFNNEQLGYAAALGMLQLALVVVLLASIRAAQRVITDR